MYYQYFGLAEAPFSIAVNPRYLYMSPRHRDALAHLLYGVGAGGGFILLTGEVGTGKTTINRCLLEQLPDNADVAMVLNPALDARDLLAAVCDELGISFAEPQPGLKALTDSLHQYLLENHAKQRKTVLMIDEAQHLDFEVLEQIRLLTNLETKEEKLLHIILIGQPELASKLARPELRQLNQRITARFDLQPLSARETGAYIRHRLHVAGLADGHELFSHALVSAVHRRARGVPRLINLLCDRMLLGAYGQNSTRLNRRLLSRAADEVLGPGEGLSWRPSGPVLLSAMVVSLLIAVAIWLARTDYLAVDSDRTLANESGSGDRRPVEAASLVPGDRPPARKATPVSAAPTGATRGAVRPTAEGNAVTPSFAPGQPSLPQATEDSPGEGAADWRLSVGEGVSVMASLYDVPLSTSARDICALELPPHIRCERGSVSSWNALLEEARPALLALVDARRLESRVLFLGIEADDVIISGASGLDRVSLAELAPQWTGEYWRLWQMPPSMMRTIRAGDRGDDVRELARLFAELDQQSEPLSQGQFNARLAQRLRLFQERSGLDPDGILGAQTLRALVLAAGRDMDMESARRKLAAEIGGASSP